MESSLNHRVLTWEEHDDLIRHFTTPGKTASSILPCDEILDLEDSDVINQNYYTIGKLHSLIATVEVTDIICDVKTYEGKRLLVHVNCKLLGSGSFLTRMSLIS